MNKILICVDCQNDFIEDGKLPVQGGRKAMNRLYNFLKKHGKEYSAIICTLDWHPYKHCSFVDNGGIWPVHCVQYTHGAALCQRVADALPMDKVTIYVKGTTRYREEYSFLDNAHNKTAFERQLSKLQPDVIDVCGIAGDVCVLNTARSLIKMGLKEKLRLITSAIASIDSNVTAKFASDNTIKTIK